MLKLRQRNDETQKQVNELRKRIEALEKNAGI